jgi:catechol 2,3-dioxygenase-like lactoylglutathione lyase family enzyme
MPLESATRPIRLGRSIPVLFVTDVQASAAFYRDALGFTIDFLHGEPPFYGAVSRDAACLHLKCVHDPVFSVGQDDRDGVIMAFVDVDNVDALYAEYVAKGVTFTQRLQREAWGGDAFYACDLDGNAICFARRNTDA